MKPGHCSGLEKGSELGVSVSTRQALRPSPSLSLTVRPKRANVPFWSFSGATIRAGDDLFVSGYLRSER